MYLSDAFQLMGLGGANAVAGGACHAESGTVFDNELKSCHEWMANMSFFSELKNDLLFYSPQSADRIHGIRVSDRFVELLDSSKWTCVFLDYDLSNLNCDLEVQDHQWFFLNSDSLPPEPEMLLLNRKEVGNFFECLSYSLNNNELEWQDLICWLGFFSRSIINPGGSLLLWPPLRATGGYWHHCA